MILLDDVLIEDDILKKKFCCDLKKCKGACCTFEGEFGAPVLDSEVQLMNEVLPIAKKYLSEKSMDYIEKNGIIEGTPDNYTTVCIENRDCIFVYWENDIAFCSIEKAFLNGETKFQKPLSCHLFPIRVASWNNGQLYFAHIDECKPALKKGGKENIHLIECVKDALIRKYGEEWYRNLEKYVNR